MPHNSLKLVPGVDQNRTPALNEAALSYSNLIRFVPDQGGVGLVQKLGGWTKFFAGQITSIVRALWGWEDTNSNKWLAVGCESNGVNTTLLSVINNGTQTNITPRTFTDNVAVSVSTTSGSNVVTITDTGSNITNYDSVYISTQISVGGLILFGFYPTTLVSSNTYQINAVDVFGNPLYATSTVTNGGAVPSFATTSGSGVVTVTLNNHGYTNQTVFPVLISTTVGGITIYGNYQILSIINANTFTIQANSSATSSTTGQENAGNANYTYYIGIGPLPAGSGFGVNGFGVGGFGSGVAPSAAPGNPITVSDWTLDNWGQLLISCPQGGPVYQWDPTSGNPVATAIYQGPVINDGAFVAMPQRQIITWGSTFNGIQDPLLLRWCDINNYQSWIAQTTNQAGSYRIPKGSKIVGCIQGPQQGLVWTDLALWSMQYIGYPSVYGFNEVGTGCGLIAKKAATSLNGVVYWMGQSQFFSYSSAGVQPIFCPVWDVIFQDLDTTNLNKIRVAANSRFGEIAWFYPTKGNGGEINAYVKYNVNLQQWDFGTLSRTAWINESVLGPPIGFDPNSNYIYQHETSADADGQPLPAAMQTGYFELSEADVLTFIDQVWPDMRWGYYAGTSNGQVNYQTPTATVNLTFYVTNYPGDTPIAYGPYQLTQSTEYITPRFRGRLVSVAISNPTDSTGLGTFWRIGNMRYRYQPDGKF